MLRKQERVKPDSAKVVRDEVLAHAVAFSTCLRLQKLVRALSNSPQSGGGVGMSFAPAAPAAAPVRFQFSGWGVAEVSGFFEAYVTQCAPHKAHATHGLPELTGSSLDVITQDEWERRVRFSLLTSEISPWQGLDLSGMLAAPEQYLRLRISPTNSRLD